MVTDIPHGYEAAYSGCVLIDRNDVSRLWASGRDSLDLLHRMSTNDLMHMMQNEGRATVLTTAQGRIVDYLVTINLGKRVLLLGSHGRSEQVRKWLDKHIFFHDEVTIIDATGELGQLGLYGYRSSSVADVLVSGAANLSLYHTLSTGQVWVMRSPALAGGGYELIGPRADIESLATRAEQLGAVWAGSELYEILRIEEGFPGIGSEISDKYIPLEVGLWEAVSFDKGCYIGQEIIARMESRGKLAKTLIGLRSDTEMRSGTTLRTQDGDRSGIVTSSIHSPRMGWIGLGLIKPDLCMPGLTVTAELNGELLPVTVRSLPFGK